MLESMAVKVVKINYMPIYTAKCVNCGFKEEMFFGKVISENTFDKICKQCGHQGLQKIPMPINNAKFSGSMSRRSMKTRTGVGEVIMNRGGKDMLNSVKE